MAKSWQSKRILLCSLSAASNDYQVIQLSGNWRVFHPRALKALVFRPGLFQRWTVPLVDERKTRFDLNRRHLSNYFGSRHCQFLCFAGRFAARQAAYCRGSSNDCRGVWKKPDHSFQPAASIVNAFIVVFANALRMLPARRAPIPCFSSFFPGCILGVERGAGFSPALDANKDYVSKHHDPAQLQTACDSRRNPRVFAAVRPKTQRLHKALQGQRTRLHSGSGPGGASSTRTTSLSGYERSRSASRRRSFEGSCQDGEPLSLFRRETHELIRFGAEARRVLRGPLLTGRLLIQVGLRRGWSILRCCAQRIKEQPRRGARSRAAEDAS